MKATEVFTPNSFPRHSYVEREGENFEEDLADSLDVPGRIVSLSGPSKSGKTVLVEKVVGEVALITITGAGIEDPSEVWSRILDWMDVPHETSESEETGGSASIGGEAKGSVKAPLFAEVEGSGKGEIQASGSSGESEMYGRRGMAQVVEEISDSDFVILIDNFHYMPRDTQSEVAKQIREPARRGVSIVTAAVPHRSDDVVRSNPELRGRVETIDLNYWEDSDLRRIGVKGFDALNASINEQTLNAFAREAAGSPQLMQAICLNACFEIGLKRKNDTLREFDVDEDQRTQIFERTSATTSFRSLVEVLDSGPKTRGTERKEYNFEYGTSGDVYRCILKAISSDPPTLSFSYDELLDRIENICVGESPPGSSVIGSCEHMSNIALDKFPKERVIDWDESKLFLDIPDPYILFYLRWSGHLVEEER